MCCLCFYRIFPRNPSIYVSCSWNFNVFFSISSNFFQVIQAFVEGDCNTLISTCIGEEGLDVGEVDLIVCFDISNKSPVRMIQRIGRTGRKRDGRVVILVTEGREEQTLKACLIQKHYMSKTILGSTELAQKLYKENSRMMPDDIVPECMKINIVVKKETKIKNETIKVGIFRKMYSVS